MHHAENLYSELEIKPPHYVISLHCEESSYDHKFKVSFHGAWISFSLLVYKLIRHA